MPPRYQTPPVIEAICEFRFDPSSAWDMAIPGLISEKVKETHPKRRQVKAIDMVYSTQPQNTLQQATVEDRLHLLSEDEKSIIQIGRHVLVVNRLTPYSSWRDFLPAIEHAFGQYLSAANPKALSKIGLRYLNRIDIPNLVVRLEEYFDVYAFLGPALPQVQTAFFVGVEFPYEQERDRLRLQLQSAVSQDKQKLAFLMDLEYQTARPGEVNFESVGRWLQGAHERIEAVFEGSLKSKTRDIFKPY